VELPRLCGWRTFVNRDWDAALTPVTRCRSEPRQPADRAPSQAFSMKAKATQHLAGVIASVSEARTRNGRAGYCRGRRFGQLMNIMAVASAISNSIDPGLKRHAGAYDPRGLDRWRWR
jgi:hypothetical protein